MERAAKTCDGVACLYLCVGLCVCVPVCVCSSVLARADPCDIVYLSAVRCRSIHHMHRNLKRFQLVVALQLILYFRQSIRRVCVFARVCEYVNI